MRETSRIGILNQITINKEERIKIKTITTKSILFFVGLSSLVLLRVGYCSCPTLLNHEFPKLQDESPQNLCQYKDSVVLVVNTASFCGYTKQYEGLESLYEKYKNRGLVVLGFPSGDFRNQEYSSNKKIAEFCKNTYGVKFPMFARSNVVDGEKVSANPLFKRLAELAEPPRWNFHKYLISRDGTFHKSYSSFTSPTSKSVVSEIETLLKSRR